MLDTVSALIGLSLGTSSPALQVLNPAEPAAVVSVASTGVVEARKGTKFLVDTKLNMGYLIHTDGSIASFKVATGRNEVVNYLGLRYKATTPVEQWKVTKIKTQSDTPSNRVTFGSKRRFLRLNDTNYGIHDYLYLEEILAKPAEERFFSMGCILVTSDILEVLEDIYTLNGGVLDVQTVYGLKTPTVAQKS